MNQVIFLFISFCYGLVSGMLYFFINGLLKKENIIYYLIMFTYYLIITVLYIILFLILNNGDIHLYLKLVLILGFFTSYKVSIICKKRDFINKY